MQTLESPNDTLPTARVVSPQEWLVARRAHLVREKEITRLRDELYAERRELPWLKVEPDYVFDAPEGKVRLADLFGGCSQLIVYHFMFGPDWEQGCKSCSLLGDHLDGPVFHLAQHDVAFVAVARAPLARIAEFKRRMGWKFRWVSSHGSSFNFDFKVSLTPEEMANGADYNYGKLPAGLDFDELPGASVFVKSAAGELYHTYSTYARGLDILLGVHNLLDLTPGGRRDGQVTMEWVRHHDRYENAT